MNIYELLKERNLPDLKNVEEMKKILLDNEYGHIPDIKYNVDVSAPTAIRDGKFCAGTAELTSVTFTVTTQYGSHSFPVVRLLHNDGKKHPFFVFINFRAAVPDFFYPTEEIAQQGFDVLSVCYTDITSDDKDFENGIAKLLLPNGQETDTTCGKIMLWAWAASRILDYAQTLDCLDSENAAVLGHSRLGKTALVAAMMDNRFKYSFSNDSGCSGASLARGNLGTTNRIGPNGQTGETILAITNNFPYWFCKKYLEYNKTNIPENFDQHFLVASIYPRHPYVASASMDDWADPDSEFLSCLAASEIYEKNNMDGLICKTVLPKAGETFHDGNIGYHRTYGKHFLSRNDWNNYMKFVSRKMENSIND